MAPKGLLDWMDDPSSERGLHLRDGDGWERIDYATVAAAARARSARLRASTDPATAPAVVLALRPGLEFVAWFFGALHAGLTPCPVVPPLPFQPRDQYRSHVLGLLRTAAPQHLVTTTEVRDMLAEGGLSVPRVHLVDHPSEVPPDDGPPAPGGLPRYGLLQFTSGSSGPPRAVRVPAPSLALNIHWIRTWLGMADDDVTATWLPMHHDMGLIGCTLTPIVNQTDVFVMPPEDFIAQPARWLRCLGELGGTLTAVPSFGLGYVVRRVAPEALDGMDFSRWRVTIVGAERVERSTLDAFADLLAPHGFDRRSFCPAYGLAEATLAVTGLPVDAIPTSVRVPRSRLDPGAVVAEPEEGDEVVELVGCGMPLGDGTVEIHHDGAEVPDGTLGEIVVTSPAVGDGYLGIDPDRPRPAEGPTLATGDSGFVRDGQLYVVGRLGDSLKVKGRTVFAEDVEALLIQASGLARARAVVLLGALRGVDTAVALVEKPEGEWVEEVGRFLERRLGDLDVVVAACPRGTVARTSSGKPRRRPMWQTFAAGELDEMVVHHARRTHPTVEPARGR